MYWDVESKDELYEFNANGVVRWLKRVLAISFALPLFCSSISLQKLSGERFLRQQNGEHIFQWMVWLNCFVEYYGNSSRGQICPLIAGLYKIKKVRMSWCNVVRRSLIAFS